MREPATSTPAPTRQIIKLASALTSGLTPSFTLEKITIGSVLAPAPETNLDITKSSSESVKLSSQPEANAGAMPGRVVSMKARTGPDPRSMAASSSDRSALANLDCTVTVTYALQNAMCAITTIVIAHIAFCSAYVTVTVQSRLASADRSLEEAAMDLGSGPVRAFIDTTLPGIAPALASGWLLSFTLSLDDLVISSFVSGPGASTLPMVIFSKVKLGVSPDVNALASLMICLVGAGVLVAGYFMRRAERQRVLDAQMAER